MSTHNIFIEKDENFYFFLMKNIAYLYVQLLKGVSAIFSSFDFNEF